MVNFEFQADIKEQQSEQAQAQQTLSKKQKKKQQREEAENLQKEKNSSELATVKDTCATLTGKISKLESKLKETEEQHAKVFNF